MQGQTEGEGERKREEERTFEGRQPETENQHKRDGGTAELFTGYF